MRTLLLVGVMAGLAVGQTPKQPPKEPAGNPLVGKWELVEVLRGDAPDDEMKGSVREFKADGTYTLTAAPGRQAPTTGGRYTMDATKTPPHVDMVPTGGRYAGRTLKGVYKLDGDTLIVTFSEPDLPRPADTEPKPNRTRNIHRRVK